MQLPPSQRSVSSTTIAKLAIASSIAIGTAAIVTPARAAYFYSTDLETTSLNFTSSNLNNFYSEVNPVSGDTFNANFPATTNIGGSTGAFDTLFPNPSPVTTVPSPVTFTYDSTYTRNGKTYISYELLSDLSINFGNGINLDIKAGSLFESRTGNGSYSFTSTDVPTGSAFYHISQPLERTDLDTLSFALNANNNATYGGYTIIATTKKNSVPEPLTIIGTLLGGAAAMRMRKKLTSTQQ